MKDMKDKIKHIQTVLEDDDLTIDDFINETDLYDYVETGLFYDILDNCDTIEEQNESRDELYEICGIMLDK